MSAPGTTPGPEPKFAALTEGDDWDFRYNREPKCPHCGEDINVADREMWELYQEGEHEIECPRCEGEFTVSSSVTYSFSTDEQGL